VTEVDGYPSLHDYIIGITEEIWEKRGIHLIRRWYSKDCVMLTPAGFTRGVEGVVHGTLETLHAFPDRELLGEDVIWSDDGPARGLLSSHRIISNMRHMGEGIFGPPTGRTLSTRTVADCLVVNGVITEEWLVRDQSGIALQLGLDPAEHGRRLGAEDAAKGTAGWHLPMLPGIRRGEVEGALLMVAHMDAEALAATLEATFNRAELSTLRDLHDRAVALYLPGNRLESGWPVLDRFVLGYLAAFPDARLVVDHCIALDEPGRPVRVAARFRIAATHNGRGAFGAPTGAEVMILGIVHAEFAGAKINRAWWLLDELSLHRMIGAHTG